MCSNSTSCANSCAAHHLCARPSPYRRACPGNDRAVLDSAFALFANLANGFVQRRELGFGGLADPQHGWGASKDAGIVLEPREFLDAATLLETAGWLKPQFKEEALKFPLLAARAALLADFRDLLTAIRRAFFPTAKSATTLRLRSAASAPASTTRARQSKKRSSKFSAHAMPKPAKTMSRCETTASSFPFAPNSAAQFPV